MVRETVPNIQAIPSTVLAAAQTKVDEVLTALAPYLLALTPAERRELPKMGEKTIGFMEKAFDFVRQNPHLLPAYFSADSLSEQISPNSEQISWKSEF